MTVVSTSLKSKSDEPKVVSDTLSDDCVTEMEMVNCSCLGREVGKGEPLHILSRMESLIWVSECKFREKLASQEQQMQRSELTMPLCLFLTADMSSWWIQHICPLPSNSPSRSLVSFPSQAPSGGKKWTCCFHLKARFLSRMTRLLLLPSFVH